MASQPLKFAVNQNYTRINSAHATYDDICNDWNDVAKEYLLYGYTRDNVSTSSYIPDIIVNIIDDYHDQLSHPIYLPPQLYLDNLIHTIPERNRYIGNYKCCQVYDNLFDLTNSRISICETIFATLCMGYLIVCFCGLAIYLLILFKWQILYASAFFIFVATLFTYLLLVKYIYQPIYTKKLKKRHSLIKLNFTEHIIEEWSVSVKKIKKFKSMELSKPKCICKVNDIKKICEFKELQEIEWRFEWFRREPYICLHTQCFQIAIRVYVYVPNTKKGLETKTLINSIKEKLKKLRMQSVSVSVHSPGCKR